MKYLDSKAKMEVLTTLMVFDEVYVWYDNTFKKFEVTSNMMLVSEKQNKEFVAKYYQKDFYKDSQELNELYEAYEKAIRPIYAKTFDF